MVGLLQAIQPKQLQAAIGCSDALINNLLNSVLLRNGLTLPSHKTAVLFGVKLLGQADDTPGRVGRFLGGGVAPQAGAHPAGVYQYRDEFLMTNVGR